MFLQVGRFLDDSHHKKDCSQSQHDHRKPKESKSYHFSHSKLLPAPHGATVIPCRKGHTGGNSKTVPPALFLSLLYTNLH